MTTVSDLTRMLKRAAVRLPGVPVGDVQLQLSVDEEDGLYWEASLAPQHQPRTVCLADSPEGALFLLVRSRTTKGRVA